MKWSEYRQPFGAAARRVNVSGDVELDQLFVQRIPEAVAERRGFDAAALARIGVEEAADESLLLDALLQVGNDRRRVDVRRQRQAADAAERIGVELHLLGDDVVGFLDEPLHEPGMLARHHLIRPGRDQLEIGAHFLELREVGAAAEHRRVERFLDVFVIGQVAASSVGAAVGQDLSLVDVQTVWSGDVAVRVDDHEASRIRKRRILSTSRARCWHLWMDTRRRRPAVLRSVHSPLSSRRQTFPALPPSKGPLPR